MIITHSYSLEPKQRYHDTFYVRNLETAVCPECGRKMAVIGSRSRRILLEDGTPVYLIVRRLYCEQHRRIHHELPDMIVPYKRYGTQAILYAISDENDFPIACESSTIRRLRHWFSDILNSDTDPFCLSFPPPE